RVKRRPGELLRPCGRANVHLGHEPAPGSSGCSPARHTAAPESASPTHGGSRPTGRDGLGLTERAAWHAMCLVLSRSNPSPAGRPLVDPDPDLASDVSEELLERAREAARRVGDRVRRALPPPANLRVLVVDDNPDAADALAAVLD